MLEEVSSGVKSLQNGIAALEASMAEGESGQLVAGAAHCRDSVLPAMGAVREAADALEGLVADDLWPLPTYQEMLFIR
jgi:glutamine synthetase